ncbi:hypothetical protein BAE40_29680 [Mesorhizobium loti]|nr:hypothetical protein BAE40_29680 [Mesorhizobium loti]
MQAARERVDLQRSFGAHTVFLEPGALKQQFPWLNVRDPGGGSWGARDEGWFDSMGMIQAHSNAAENTPICDVLITKNKSYHGQSATIGTQRSALTDRLTDLPHIAHPNFSGYRHNQ